MNNARRIRAGAAAAVTGPVFAADQTVYAAPSGSGTRCPAAQPCSLSTAQLVQVGGTYDTPAHHITFSDITTGTSWLGPDSSQGYADQQTGAYITGNGSRPAFTSCHQGCPQFEATRPHWQQSPAAVQVSAADNVTFTGSQFADLGQTAIGIGDDANAHGGGVGLGATDITVNRSEIARNVAGGIIVGSVRAGAHHPGDSRMVNRNITVSRTPECPSAPAGAPTTPGAATTTPTGVVQLPAALFHGHHRVRQPDRRQLHPRRHAADERRRLHLHPLGHPGSPRTWATSPSPVTGRPTAAPTLRTATGATSCRAT
ncbi:hypothetical protein [Paractinoplanes abujensis]|uniref:Uncharacterized protein n=1 Tax=Paractinoplanes abujensis TaxID=882441 RepID=A0A7W7CR94_9ACTN|nr:hypothetical protein [Actinoplanes abujensis]MBB4693242.1 hypothetical protein [Actinoplanes abujensis]